MLQVVQTSLKVDIGIVTMNRTRVFTYGKNIMYINKFTVETARLPLDKVQRYIKLYQL